ncbi:MAG: TIGR03032 family protein [Planctomycetaceae bacterium]|nr:TIGR03032 family protein [Planctomycetaceae bacterium]
MSTPDSVSDSPPASDGQPAQATAAPAGEGKPELEPLRSVHTNTFPAALEQLRSSLLVTTYQAGRLVALRPDNGVLNTHFRGFNKPMGLAVSGARLAIGTRAEIWEYHVNPAVAPKMEPKGRCDCCFMPRNARCTADMQIHEMEWVGDELWFVNTLFSCLAVRSDQYSFIPKWRPPFITALAPEDRCHLNGMCQRDGIVRYVTALGHTDKPNGWRENKKSGGILMDVTTGDVILEGLSMPHSPRWYDGKLWLLESGNGSIGYVDLERGKYEAIAELPGFTRGIDFVGPLAFIGLSQVRESATFSGIPLTERLEERTCGVWAVNIQNGQTVGWVKFEDAVQEIFAVSALRGVTYPDLVNHDIDILAGSFVLPDEALAQVPAGYRGEKSGTDETPDGGGEASADTAKGSA